MGESVAGYDIATVGKCRLNEVAVVVQRVAIRLGPGRIPCRVELNQIDIITARTEALYRSIATIRDAMDLGMCVNQMAVLESHLDGFEARMASINERAAEIARRLQASPDVAEVFYPGYGSSDAEALAAELFKPGRSGLVSFLLKEQTPEALEAFYDAVDAPIQKGPGFGGTTSLLCPYVLLAHYNDDKAFLEEHKLDFNLLRLSVGIEDPQDLIEDLKEGLAHLTPHSLEREVALTRG